MTIDIPREFAAVTAMLEDMHDVAVQGQHPENTAELQLGLLACFRIGLVALGERTDALGAAIRLGNKT